jgi:hypothetical protein
MIALVKDITGTPTAAARFFNQHCYSDNQARIY